MYFLFFKIAPLNCFYLYHDKAGRLSHWLEGEISPSLLEHSLLNSKAKDLDENRNRLGEGIYDAPSLKLF